MQNVINNTSTSFEFYDWKHLRDKQTNKKKPSRLMADLPQFLKFTTLPSFDIYCSAALVFESLK